MNSYFIAIVLDHQNFNIFKETLRKNNPFYKFIPLHIPLTDLFESPLEQEQIKNEIKDIFKFFHPFDLFFKNIVQHKNNSYLKIYDDKNILKKLKLSLHSKKILKKNHYQHLMDNPLIAKNKSPERILKKLPIKTIPTFNIPINKIHIIKIKSNEKVNLNYYINLSHPK